MEASQMPYSYQVAGPGLNRGPHDYESASSKADAFENYQQSYPFFMIISDIYTFVKYCDLIKEIYCGENDKIASPIASPKILFITF